MTQKKILFILLFVSFLGNSQNIKTIQLRPLGSKQFAAITSLGSVLELSFDDLEADSKDYQYKIEKMNADWQPSNLSSNQYINGFEQNQINEISNSFNTLQNYTHYSVKIPNENTTITQSGNYVISILDEDDEIIFSRKCIFYEPITTIGVNILRSRNTKTVNEKQTIQFIVDYRNLAINNPAQEIKVLLFQNNNFDIVIKNLQPQFFKQNQLIYNYTKGTNFWGGNEFRYFDNKNIRNTNLNIAKTKRKKLWNNYLYTDTPNTKKPYTYNPDINGQFFIRTLNGNNNADESDYANIHFSLASYIPYPNKEVYVYGAFNNFKCTEENKMQYDNENSMYSISIKLKQGFYNYSYVTVDTDKKINRHEIDGSFSQTENSYTVIVYYRPLGETHDRVIGIGNGFFDQNR